MVIWLGIFAKSQMEIGTEFQKDRVSREASPTFGHANANFSLFIDRMRNEFLKK